MIKNWTSCPLILISKGIQSRWNTCGSENNILETQKQQTQTNPQNPRNTQNPPNKQKKTPTTPLPPNNNNKIQPPPKPQMYQMQEAVVLAADWSQL